MAMILGAITASALIGLGGLHAHWARGGHWPMHTDRELHERFSPPWMPTPGAGESWLVAGLLALAGLLVAAGTLGVDTWPTWAATAVAGTALALRGLGGIVVSTLWERDSAFARLDRRIFSPLCLCLAVGTMAALPG